MDIVIAVKVEDVARVASMLVSLVYDSDGRGEPIVRESIFKAVFAECSDEGWSPFYFVPAYRWAESNLRENGYIQWDESGDDYTITDKGRQAAINARAEAAEVLNDLQEHMKVCPHCRAKYSPSLPN